MFYMKFSIAVLLLAALSAPLASPAADTRNLPESIGPEPALNRIADVQTWDPDTMFEHVNGEAELLKRYGAISLSFVSYENDSGDYFSVDLLDLGKPLNAYGLYRLYAGCDGTEYGFLDATVLTDEYAPHAVFGSYFFRFNVDIGSDADGGEELVNDFLKQFISILPEQPPLPATLAILQQKALRPCEVNYHPEQVDYDLESGPGYAWLGPDKQNYFITFLRSRDEAERQADSLRNKGIKTVLIRENAVIWQKTDGHGSTAYMEQTAQEAVGK